MENTAWCTNCNLSPTTARWDHWSQDRHHKLPNKVIRIRTRLFLSALLLQLLARGGGGCGGTSQIVHAEAGRQIETTHRWIHCQSLHLEKRNIFECVQLWIFFGRWRAFWSPSAAVIKHCPPLSVFQNPPAGTTTLHTMLQLHTHDRFPHNKKEEASRRINFTPRTRRTKGNREFGVRNIMGNLMMTNRPWSCWMPFFSLLGWGGNRGSLIVRK